MAEDVFVRCMKSEHKAQSNNDWNFRDSFRSLIANSVLFI